MALLAIKDLWNLNEDEDDKTPNSLIPLNYWAHVFVSDQQSFELCPWEQAPLHYGSSNLKWMQVEKVTVANLNSIGNPIIQGDLMWLFSFSCFICLHCIFCDGFIKCYC
jgi:hypothetical protein